MDARSESWFLILRVFRSSWDFEIADRGVATETCASVSHL